MTRHHRRTVWVTLAALLSAGWATNHFAAMLPALADVARISGPGLDAAFGLYALGLLPSLLLGGGQSDRIGRRPVVLAGLTLAGAGNVVMLIWPALAGVILGRLVVGLGVGMVASAGSAWAADQDGAKGGARAGVVLTTGFAVGPVASGLVTHLVPGRVGVTVAFAVPVVLTAVAGVLCLIVGRRGSGARHVGEDVAGDRVGDRAGAATAGASRPATTTASSAPFVDGRRVGTALGSALPMALWVFSTVAVAMIVLTHRIGAEFSGPLLPAVASVLSLGTGVLVQVTTRRVAHWRPLGVIGAGLAAAGLALAGAAGGQMSLAVFAACSIILGAAYGLCLGQGLQDVGRLAPPAARGMVTGLFYVVAYSGFALPFVLNTYQGRLGASAPMSALAGLAVASAVGRLWQIRRGFDR